MKNRNDQIVVKIHDAFVVSFRNAAFVALLLLCALSFILAACTPDAMPSATVTSTVLPETASLIHVRVGVSPIPHADIINFIKENLALSAGLEIELIEFTDYVQPNLALADGTLDANYFQHVPYMEDFNVQHKTNLVAVALVHIEPLGIYSKKITSLREITDHAVVAIPNDATNAGRALHLLASNELLSLKEGVGYGATVNDIITNPRNLKIIELEAAQLVRSLDDTVISVINGNYALEGGFTPNKDALALESSENNPYANVLVVNKGHENDKGIQILTDLLTSSEVRKFIEENYDGSVIPAF